MRHFVLFLVSLGLFGLGSAIASPGGLDKNGCHTNKKTNEYHCHRKDGKTIPQETKKDSGKKETQKSSSSPSKKQSSEKSTTSDKKSETTKTSPKTETKSQ